MPHCSLVPALVAAAAVALAQPAEEGPRVLRPADRTAVPAGALTVIARGPGPLKLDGQAVPVQTFAGNALRASLVLRAGVHELSIGDHAVRFFAGSGAPPDFRPYRLHPPGETDCAACHAVREGFWEFRGASSSCFGCHDLKKFPAGHTHNSEVLSECGLCHDPHGSAEKLHLKLSREAACKQCHS